MSERKTWTVRAAHAVLALCDAANRNGCTREMLRRLGRVDRYIERRYMRQFNTAGCHGVPRESAR